MIRSWMGLRKERLNFSENLKEEKVQLKRNPKWHLTTLAYIIDGSSAVDLSRQTECVEKLYHWPRAAVVCIDSVKNLKFLELS